MHFDSREITTSIIEIIPFQFHSLSLRRVRAYLISKANARQSAVDSVISDSSSQNIQRISRYLIIFLLFFFGGLKEAECCCKIIKYTRVEFIPKRHNNTSNSYF